MFRSGLPAFLVTCGLSKASLVRGSARSTPSNATARMLQDADGTSCNIGDLFQHLTRIRVDSECRAGCHGGDGQCDAKRRGWGVEKGEGREIVEARIYDFYEKSVKTSACRMFPLSNIAETPKEC